MTTKTTSRRKLQALPLDPLWKIARSKLSDPQADASMTVGAFAEACGVNPRAVIRWRKEGALPWPSADKAAIGLGLHPILVWGNQWLQLDSDIDALADDEWAMRADESAADLADSALDR